MKDTLKIFQSIVRNVLKFKFVEYVLNFYSFTDKSGIA